VVEQHNVKNVFSVLENDVKPKCVISGHVDFELNVGMRYYLYSL